MVRWSVIVAAAFAAVAEAQTATPKASTTVGSAPSQTSSTAAVTHTISVGATGFKFEPNNITAAVGDWVEFLFYPGGHSVAQSDFRYPCIPWELAGPGRGPGFWSGTINTNVYSTDGPKYRVRINDTRPIFYYCNAPTSCFKEKMIGAINPNATWSLEKQTEYVNNATFQVTPGEPLPSEGAGIIPVPTGYPPAGPVTPTPTAAPASAGGDDHRLGAGQIAGISIGAAAVLVLAGALIYICGRQSRGNNRRDDNRASYPAVPVGAMVDTKYHSPSPGQSSFRATTAYSTTPSNDPYGAGPHSPPLHQHPTTAQPGSPGAHPTYTTYQTLGPLVQSPTGHNGVQPGFYHGQAHTPPPPPNAPPVELPGSADPGNSPIPPYSNRQMSWSAGTETRYQPSGKAGQ